MQHWLDLRALPAKATLEDLYLNQALDVGQIAFRLGRPAGDISAQLRAYGIPYRKPRPRQDEGRHIEITKSLLEELYLRQQLSGPATARVLDCPVEVVYRRLRRYGIARRSSGRRA